MSQLVTVATTAGEGDMGETTHVVASLTQGREYDCAATVQFSNHGVRLYVHVNGDVSAQISAAVSPRVLAEALEQLASHVRAEAKRREIVQRAAALGTIREVEGGIALHRPA